MAEKKHIAFGLAEDKKDPLLVEVAGPGSLSDFHPISEEHARDAMRAFCVAMLYARVQWESLPESTKINRTAIGKTQVVQSTRSKNESRQRDWVNTLASFLYSAKKARPDWYLNLRPAARPLRPHYADERLHIQIVFTHYWIDTQYRFYWVDRRRKKRDSIKLEDHLQIAAELEQGEERWISKLLESHLPTQSHLKSTNADASKPLTSEAIASLKPWAAVALATRCAFRVAPCLGQSEGLAFWGEKRREFCAAIEASRIIAALAAAGKSRLRVSEGMSVIQAVARNAGDCRAGNRPVPDDRSIWAAVAVVEGARAAEVGHKELVAHKTEYSDNAARESLVAYTNGNIEVSRLLNESVWFDYEWLVEHGFAQSDPHVREVPEEFFSRPLWKHTYSGWENHIGDWGKIMESIGLANVKLRQQLLRDGLTLNEMERVIIQQWPELL